MLLSMTETVINRRHVERLDSVKPRTRNVMMTWELSLVFACLDIYVRSAVNFHAWFFGKLWSLR